LSEQTTTRAEQTTEILEAEPLLEDGDWPEAEHAPITRRRGLTGMLTPFRVGLLCLLILVAGFIGGVLVQKGSGGGSSAAQNPFGSDGLPSFLTGAGQGNSTMGTVATVAGGTLYVTDAQGKTVKVLTTGATKVTRSTESKPRDIHPGDSVVIQGAARRSGTVKAQSVSATASGASTGAPALGGGATGGTGGSSGSSGGGSSAVNQLFGN
jgi:hypothetical protein